MTIQGTVLQEGVQQSRHVSQLVCFIRRPYEEPNMHCVDSAATNGIIFLTAQTKIIKRGIETLNWW